MPRRLAVPDNVVDELSKWDSREKETERFLKVISDFEIARAPVCMYIKLRFMEKRELKDARNKNIDTDF